jgi:predicted aconitase with swiveling domain
VNPILVQGAALGDVPMVAGFEVDITAAIPDGAEIEVDPEAGRVRVLKPPPL